MSKTNCFTSLWMKESILRSHCQIALELSGGQRAGPVQGRSGCESGPGCPLQLSLDNSDAGERRLRSKVRSRKPGSMFKVLFPTR